MDDETTLEVIDILAHEYGWSIDYIQSLGLDEIDKLLKMIIKRNKNNFQILHSIIGHAIAGKQLTFSNSDKDTPVMSEEESLKDLMKKLGKGVKKR